MGTTPNLNLKTISPTDNPLVKDFFQDLAGNAETSNMQKIDNAIGELRSSGNVVVMAENMDGVWKCSNGANEIHEAASTFKATVTLVYIEDDGGYRVLNYSGYSNGKALFYQTKNSTQSFTGVSFEVDSEGYGILTELPFDGSVMSVEFIIDKKTHSKTFKEIMDHLKSGGMVTASSIYSYNEDFIDGYMFYLSFTDKIQFISVSASSGGVQGDSIYLASNDTFTWERSSFVADIQLNATSRNPIRNSTVTNALDTKVSLPSTGNGAVGDFAVSDGAGGITWATLVNRRDVGA